MRYQSLLFISLLSTSLCYGAPAKELWTTEMGNSAHTGYFNVTVDPAQIKLAWVKKFGEPVGGRIVPSITDPVISDSAIYLFETSTDRNVPNKLEALNPATGEFLWRQNISSARLFNLTLNQNKLYAVEDEHVSSTVDDVRIQAYSADDGKLIFSTLTNYATGAWYTSTTVLDGMVYAGSMNLQMALNADSGAQQWHVESLKDSLISTTAATSKYLLRNKDDGMYVVNRATGAIEGNIIAAEDTTSNAWNIPAWDETTRTAISVIYFYPHDTCNGCYMSSQLTAYDVDQKLVKWIKLLPAVEQPVFSDNDIYYSSDKKVYAANIVTGNIEWTWDAPAHVNTLLLTNNLIFASSEGAGKTFALSRKTHEIVWQTGDFGQLSIDQNRLYINNRGSSFYPHLTAYSFA